MSVVFLSTEDIIFIHRNTIEIEGGIDGLRDRALLESAAMMPQQSFGGEYLHPDLPSKGAAYLYHLCKNHPFLDGNKRVAAMSCLVFLKCNGATSLPPPEALRDNVLAVASGKLTKSELTNWTRSWVKEGPS